MRKISPVQGSSYRTVTSTSRYKLCPKRQLQQFHWTSIAFQMSKDGGGHTHCATGPQGHAGLACLQIPPVALLWASADPSLEHEVRGTGAADSSPSSVPFPRSTHLS